MELRVGFIYETEERGGVMSFEGCQAQGANALWLVNRKRPKLDLLKKFCDRIFGFNQP